MAGDAGCSEVRAGQWKIGRIVVKDIGRVSRWVTGQTSRALIDIPPDAVVIVIGFRVGMAGSAGKFCVIARICMTIHTSTPLPVVCTAVNREVLPVMVKGGRHPGRFGMAPCTIGRELGCHVIRHCRGIVVSLVASGTSIWRSVVIPVVTGGTIARNGGMRPVQHVVIIVNGKGCRCPARSRRMAAFAIHR